MPRETATERRNRLFAEDRAKEEKWKQEKPMRLLEAMARAQDLDIDSAVFHRHDVMYFSFTFDVTDHATVGRVDELTEWTMLNIEYRLKEIQDEKEKQRRLAQLRAELIARMTPDEREALGLG